MPQAWKLLTRMSWKYLWGSKSELYQQGFNSSHTHFWPDKALAWKQYVFFNILIILMANFKKIIAFLILLAKKRRGAGLCTLADTALQPSK